MTNAWCQTQCEFNGCPNLANDCSCEARNQVNNNNNNNNNAGTTAVPEYHISEGALYVCESKYYVRKIALLTVLGQGSARFQNFSNFLFKILVCLCLCCCFCFGKTSHSLVDATKTKFLIGQ